MSDLEVTERAGGIVLNPRGEVLIITNNRGRRALPKGKLETGETYEEAAKREICEEGGLTEVVIIKELGTLLRRGYNNDTEPTPSVVKRIRMYLCTTKEFTLNPVADDVVRAAWVSPDKVAETLDWPEEAEFFVNHQAILAELKMV